MEVHIVVRISSQDLPSDRVRSLSDPAALYSRVTKVNNFRAQLGKYTELRRRTMKEICLKWHILGVHDKSILPGTSYGPTISTPEIKIIRGVTQIHASPVGLDVNAPSP